MTRAQVSSAEASDWRMRLSDGRDLLYAIATLWYLGLRIFMDGLTSNLHNYLGNERHLFCLHHSAILYSPHADHHSPG